MWLFIKMDSIYFNFSSLLHPYPKNVGQYNSEKIFYITEDWHKEIYRKAKLGFFPDNLVDEINSFTSPIVYDKNQLNTLDEKNCTPLYQAIYEGFRPGSGYLTKRIYFMLKSGADPNLGESVLHLAFNLSPDIVYLLLAFGVDLNRFIKNYELHEKILWYALNFSDVGLLYAFMRCGYQPHHGRYEMIGDHGHAEQGSKKANGRLEICMILNFFSCKFCRRMDLMLQIFLQGYDPQYISTDEHYKKKYINMYKYFKIIFSNFILIGNTDLDDFILKFLKVKWGSSFITTKGMNEYNQIIGRFLPLFKSEGITMKPDILFQAMMNELPIDKLINLVELSQINSTNLLDYLVDYSFIKPERKERYYLHEKFFDNRGSPEERTPDEIEQKAIYYMRLLIKAGVEIGDFIYKLMLKEKYRMVVAVIETSESIDMTETLKRPDIKAKLELIMSIYKTSR